MWYPLDRSEWGERGVAAYAKHPLYPVLLAGADRAGGLVGMVALSVLGTALAAVGSALLSIRVRPGIERSVLWAVGLGSPLFFDSFWVIAHSLAAACVAWAVLAWLLAVERRQPAWCLLGAMGVGLAVGLRTEALLWGAGVLAAAAVLLVWRRDWMWAFVGVSALGAMVVARWLEGVGRVAAVGQAVASPQRLTAVGTDSRISNAASGFVRAWLSPAEQSTGAVLLLVIGCTLALGVAWELGRSHPDGDLVRRVSVIAAAFVTLRAIGVSPSAVPGLLPAFPLLWIGLIAGRRAAMPTLGARFLMLVSAIGAAGVLATQYGVGGDTEWGGRYFAIFLPLVVPLAIAGLCVAGARLAPSAGRIALGSLVAGSVALSGLAVRDLRTVHAATDAYYRRVERAAETLPAPVIVSTEGYGARLAWRTFDQQQWLFVDPDQDRMLGARLAEAGIDRFVLVSRDVEHDLDLFDGLRIDDSVVPPTSTLAVITVSNTNISS
jgi:hypothetical protein